MQKKLFTLLILSAFSANYIHSEVVEEVVVQASLLGQTEDGISVIPFIYLMVMKSLIWQLQV